MTVHTETADVLDAAADYIEKHGWTQGYLGDDGEPRCAVGAILSGAPDCDFLRAHAAMTAHARSLGFAMISLWNNAPGRTVQEVLDELRDAAKHERRLDDEQAP